MHCCSAWRPRRCMISWARPKARSGSFRPAFISLPPPNRKPLTWRSRKVGGRPRTPALTLVRARAVARALNAVIQRATDRIPARTRHITGGPDETVGHQLGTIAKLIIWLVGIMAALQFLGFAQVLAPINELVTEIFAFLPHLIAAGLIFFVGLVVARIVRRLVETVLIAANIDGLLARIGIGSTEGTVRTEPAAVPP